MNKVKKWLGDIPVVSLALFKVCRRGTSSVVYLEWRWRKCADPIPQSPEAT